jgi:hypothetical protein
VEAHARELLTPEVRIAFAREHFGGNQTMGQ